MADAFTCRGCELTEERWVHVPSDAKGAKVRLVPTELAKQQEQERGVSGAEGR